jgi:hypothetical protein
MPSLATRGEPLRKRLCLILTGALAVGALFGASSASAATGTEFGSNCPASEYFSGGEVSVSHGPGSPLPLAAPMSGVITEWKVNVGNLEIEPPFEPGILPTVLYEELYVLRSAGPSQYTVVGKADSGAVLVNTVNLYKTRIPVQQGDLLGLGGSTTVYCETGDTRDVTVDFRGVPGLGATFQTGEPFEGFQSPVQAKIEPDVDGDGYGDETQDGCPQSAAYHEACPVVKIDSLATSGSKAVTLHVTTSLTAPVAVSATVGLGKGKKATLTAPSQTVSAGALTPFSLALTPQVTKALAALPKGKSLTMTINASATNVTGAPSSAITTVKLKGLGKISHKNGGKKKNPRGPKAK